MSELYEVLDTAKVLDTVIDAVSKTQESLIVVEGETDNNAVRPDERYFKTLQNLLAHKKPITRYYFGSLESFAQKRQQTKDIIWHYAGPMEQYQRAIIINNHTAFFKIGNTFAKTHYQPLITLLKNYLQKNKETQEPSGITGNNPCQNNRLPSY